MNEDVTLETLDESLNKLLAYEGGDFSKFMRAAPKTAVHDGCLALVEAYLIRVIAANRN